MQLPPTKHRRKKIVLTRAEALWLTEMIEQMNKTTAKANAAIDAALAFVEASNARIEEVEKEAHPLCEKLSVFH